jgi:SAM-dependent methyltransferase
MVSREQVVEAYRLILGREPESEEAIGSQMAAHETVESLRVSMLYSPEFRRAALYSPWLLPMDECPRIDVETEAAGETELRALFERVAESWNAFGASEPYWSVLTDEAFRLDSFDQNAREYLDSGENEVARLLAWLDRNGVKPKSLGSCLEYGCGTGRITRWLAKSFERVHACDISEPHLKLAREHLEKAGCRNVEFLLTGTLESLDELPPADLIFSVIVLQHNPPPLIAHILRKLLDALRPGGVAFFQVPTYSRGYRFEAAKYLRSKASADCVEMHVLPQAEIFSIAAARSCDVLEVLPDDCVGDPDWISNTFLVRKRI